MRSRVILVSFAVFALSLSVAHAQSSDVSSDDSSSNPTACNQLFHLPTGTIQYAVDKSLMNPTVCAAYQYLISRYSVGPCSKLGLSNPQVDGITKLDPTFAVNLAAMLKAAPVYIGIISAYRTSAAQQCANPGVNSNHMRGCAVDLAYNNSNCTSQACQWIKQNAATYHLQLRLQYSPEWNHLEPQQCNGRGLGSILASNISGGNIGDETVPSNLQGAIGAGGQCAPQTICSGNTLYYESTSCTFIPSQQCPNGCAGSSCAPSTSIAPTGMPAMPPTSQTPSVTPTPAVTTSPTINPSNPITMLPQTQPVQVGSVLATPTSTQQFFQNITTQTTPSTQLAMHLFLSTTSIYTIFSGSNAPIPSQPQTQNNSFSSSFFGISSDQYSQGTFAPPQSQGFSSGATFSPLSQVLNSLSSVLTNLLHFL